MLAALIASSVKGRVVVLALCALLVGYGLRAARTAPLDVFPEFAPPKVEVQTEAPGLSTEEVEALISVPLENALNGTPGLKTIRSKSVLGLSSVVLLFEEGTDIHKARQYAQERVAAEATRLPVVARPPVILQPLSSLSRVMKIGVSSRTMSQQDMTVLALWTVRPKLMSVPGVANVAIWGQRDKPFQVLVDPDRLRAEGLTLDQITRAAQDATVLESGGYVDKPNQRLALRHRAAVRTPDDLGRTVVAFSGNAPVRLGDVARVTFGSPPPIGDAIIVAQPREGEAPREGAPGLLLIVEKQPDANTLDVTRRVEAALKELEPGLVGVDVYPTIFRPATFVERAIANLTHALLVGCGLVVVILVAFLFDWRTALISLTAVPLSLVAAVVALTAAGFTLNTMVIAGLVIALGEVVDDAIIDVENIVRRLRLNRAAGHPAPAFGVVLEASLEVRSAVVYATAIVVIVFLPVFFLDGIVGAFFRPLALAYILSVLASLAVAGVTNLKVESQTLLPQVEVRLRPDAAERYGLTPGHVRRATSTLLRGQKVGEVYEGQKRFDVVVWGAPECRADLTAVRELPVDTPAGVQVRLKDAADVLVVPMPNEIKREGASRRLDVTCDVRGRDLGAVAAEVEEKVRGLTFEPGYHPQFLGEEASRRESSRRLALLAALALAGVVLVIYSDFGSWRLTRIVAFTLPFALVGGGAGVALGGGVVSLGSLVGFVTVLGIAARNGIMLVSHYRHLEDAEGVAFGPELVRRGSEERLAPILMTALATGLALVPLVASGLKPGHEVEYPLAVVILGGLATSTLLNLFLLPPLYLRFGRRAAAGCGGPA